MIRSSKKVRKVAVITIPYQAALMGFGVVAIGAAVATVIPALLGEYLTACAFAVSVLSLGVVVNARRIVRSFRYEAKEKLTDIGNVSTEDPAELREGVDFANGSVTRLPIRRDA